MSEALRAYYIQLKSRQEELLHLIEKQDRVLSSLKMTLQQMEEQLSHSSRLPRVINPELEINKLQFFMQEQERINTLQAQLMEEEQSHTRLKEQKHRLKVELKRLELYLEKKYAQELKREQKKQEQALDEWVQHNRKSG